MGDPVLVQLEHGVPDLPELIVGALGAELGQRRALDVLGCQYGRIGADPDDGVQSLGPDPGILGRVGQQRLALDRAFQGQRRAARDVRLEPDAPVEPVEGVGCLLVPVEDRQVELTAVACRRCVPADLRAAVTDPADGHDRRLAVAQGRRDLGGCWPPGDRADRVAQAGADG